MILLYVQTVLALTSYGALIIIPSPPSQNNPSIYFYSGLLSFEGVSVFPVVVAAVVVKSNLPERELLLVGVCVFLVEPSVRHCFGVQLFASDCTCAENATRRDRVERRN